MSGAADEVKTKRPAKKKPATKKEQQKRRQCADDIFALDIGTRTVVGTVAKADGDVYRIQAAVSRPHSRRAMIDGQIEEIDEVARIVRGVKEELEAQTGIRLKNVAIAAAGRALKTRRTTREFDVDGMKIITEELVRSLELETIAAAQEELDTEQENDGVTFHCVGHSVVTYTLDGYAIKSLVSHRGKRASVEIIAAFLPNAVVESLYAVMDLNKLTVSSLTLEPIAAMNVVIPPEVRLINIALVDIGAGTSDIALSKGGAIVAYAMATTAGDEITEDIITKYLVDFDTAEEIKLSAMSETIEFTDILGIEHTVSGKELCGDLFPSVERLADTIVEHILDVNGGAAPQAIFLVGGGSLISELPRLVAEKLSIPETRVAVGGQVYKKGIDVGDTMLKGPEFVTPIGIGITSTLRKGFDFSTVSVNGRRIRVLDSRSLTVLDLLMKAGFKTNQIIGRSGRGLNFTLNGEKQSFKGEISTPASLTLNGQPASVDAPVKQGDSIEIIPAKSGISASVTVSDIAGEVSDAAVKLDGTEYPCGTRVTADGRPVGGSYRIQNGDDIAVTSVTTLGRLLSELDIDGSESLFFKGENKIGTEYLLRDGDEIRSERKPPSVQAAPSKRVFSQPPQSTPAAQPEEKKAGIRVILNTKYITLEPHENGEPNQFIELMALAEVDTANLPPSGQMVLTLNGKEADFFDELNEGDRIVIRWADK